MNADYFEGNDRMGLFTHYAVPVGWWRLKICMDRVLARDPAPLQPNDLTNS